MTAGEARVLFREWRRLESPVPRSLLDRLCDGSFEDPLDEDAPGLGWEVASSVARWGPERLRRMRGIWRKKPYRWVEAAVVWLKGGRKMIRRFPDTAVAEAACELHEDRTIGAVLKAALFARDSTAETVARAMSLPVAVVEAFDVLFFNVLDRKEDVSYRREVAGGGGGRVEDFCRRMTGGEAGPDLLEIAHHGTLGEVLAAAGLMEDTAPEMELIRKVRREALQAAADLGGTGNVHLKPAPLAVLGLAIAREWQTDESAEPRTGSLHDPYLDYLLADSKAYNESLRAKHVPPNAHGAGRIATVTRPDGNTTSYAYNGLGQLTEIGGTAEYPQVFTYNVYGDRHSLRTTRGTGSGGGSGTAYSYTLWDYNATGLVKAKYHNQTSTTIPGSVPSGTSTFTFDPFGRVLLKGTSGTGGKTTSYTYNLFGELLTINYGNDGGGADTTLTRDNAGLVSQAAEAYEGATSATSMGSGTTAYTYVAGKLDKVEYSSGHTYLPNVKLDYKAVDAAGRSTGYEVFDGTTSRLDVSYGYDAAGRLGTVGSLHGTFTYDYHPGSGIVSGYTGDSSGTVITQSRPVDFHNRIAGVVTKNGTGQTLASVAYTHDAGDRRTRARREDGSYWTYGYNTRGEITGSQRYSAAEARINGLENQYLYDDIGNRRWAKFGGGATGALSQITYTVNGNNQYTNISTPGKVWVTGRAPDGDVVKVNDVNAGRQDTWFSRELSLSNGSNPQRLTTTIKNAANTTIASGSVFAPRSSANPTYDVAGNLLTDGKWTYEWDSENRLRKMTPAHANVSAKTVEFVYDWQGRRIARKTTQGSTVVHTRYLYENWNVVAEWTLHGSATTLSTPQTYLWGLDLAGQHSGNVEQLQGAGGVGGLLAADVRKVSDASALGKLYASYDGNGNILAWSGADGQVKQRQEYDPFGNVALKWTDAASPLAASQGELTYGFSTKPEDKESKLLYYGYRYYDPSTGRWPSRDPIEEEGGVNLYGFVRNDSVDGFDILGMTAERPKFIDQSKDGEPPIGSGVPGSVAFYTHLLNTKVKTCSSNCSKVVWADGNKGITTGYRGHGGTKAHEMIHVSDAKKVYEQYIEYIEKKYLDKCMSEEKAECFNRISPLIAELVGWDWKILSDDFHVNGRDGMPGYLPKGGVDHSRASNSLSRSIAARAKVYNEIVTKLQACNLIK